MKQFSETSELGIKAMVYVHEFTTSSTWYAFARQLTMAAIHLLY